MMAAMPWIWPSSFESGADRNPLYVTIMLLALSMVSIGNGFFKPNISTIVGTPGSLRRCGGLRLAESSLVNVVSVQGRCCALHRRGECSRRRPRGI